MMENVGILGFGVYIPKGRLSAKDISLKTGETWSEDAVKNKLGVIEKPNPTDKEQSMYMAVEAARDCINQLKFDPLKIDMIIYFGEEWKEYPLSTSALFVQGKIGAKNAWGVDIQNRCSTFLTALKMAKDTIKADESVNTVLVVGGYRNIDLIDYKDNNMSFIYDVSAGAGACLVQGGMDRNLILGACHICDGDLAETCVVEVGGTQNKITKDNIDEAFKFRMLDPVLMKTRLGEESLPNWYKCIDRALERSGKLTRKDIGYLSILHMKRSAHQDIVRELNLTEQQTTYLENYGHVGQIDPCLSIVLGLKSGKIKDGTNICLLAAGLGYIWASLIIKWGK